MTHYQFEGTFRNSAWTDLPDKDEVKRSVEAAIRAAHTQVFGTQVGKVDVSSFDSSLPVRAASGFPEVDVVITWEVVE